MNENAIEILAHAKTNLWLRILGRREDGYHEIETRMVRLALADRLKISSNSTEGVHLLCDDPNLPTGEENLVIKAVRTLEAHVGRRFDLKIELEKHIPSGAGLGGGSSDAATAFRAINSLLGLELSLTELSRLAAAIGSDVPFFLYERSCDCRGRGEIVEPVSESALVPSFQIFLCKSAFAIEAAWAYKHYARSTEYPDFSYAVQSGPWGEMRNDLERPVFEKFPILGGLKNWLLQRSEVQAALLSGSGSTMLAILREGVDTEDMQKAYRDRYGETGWCWIGRTLED